MAKPETLTGKPLSSSGSEQPLDGWWGRSVFLYLPSREQGVGEGVEFLLHKMKTPNPGGAGLFHNLNEQPGGALPKKCGLRSQDYPKQRKT